MPRYCINCPVLAIPNTEIGVQHLPRRAGKATGAKPSVILRALCEMFIFAEKWRQEKQPSL